MISYKLNIEFFKDFLYNYYDFLVNIKKKDELGI